MELRDGELAVGSVKVEVMRRAKSQQLLQSVLVNQLSAEGDAQPHVFLLQITVYTSWWPEKSVRNELSINHA